MKPVFILILIHSFFVSTTFSQYVYIDLPRNALIDKTDFTAIKTVMNTNGHSHWRAGAINPTIKAVAGSNYRHTTQPNQFLPGEVLQWRLASIGGEQPPFPGGGSWPGFKWFTTSYQTWFHPTVSSTYPAGNVDFLFKIPAVQFLNNIFYAGKYKLEVTQNYGRSGFYAIEFSPETFHIVLTVPEFISFVYSNPGRHLSISSLNDFRISTSKQVIELENLVVTNTVDFNVFARTSSSTLQFTTPKGVSTFRAIPSIMLESSHTKMRSSSLTSNWKNYTSGSNHLTVEKGNKTSIPLALSISNEDFKNHFFRAGTYRFELELNLKSTDNTVSELQKTEIVLKVPPLSEINVLSGSSVVNFNFNTLEKYQAGDRKTVLNQIRISNNDMFELSVKADAPFFSKNGVRSVLPASILQVGIDDNSLKAPLSVFPQKIYSGSPVLDQDLDIRYSINPNAAESMIPIEKSTYSINVIFTLTAP